jgi:hypothetical protein
VPRDGALRFVTAALLVLIAFDLALVHSCALEARQARDSRRQALSAPECPGGHGYHHAPVHPDHCFCHGLSTVAGGALLIAPYRQAETVLESPPGHPLQASAAVYHPPQLPA